MRTEGARKKLEHCNSQPKSGRAARINPEGARASGLIRPREGRRFYGMKFVHTRGSRSGRGMLAKEMLLSSQAMLRPSVRIVCMPSRSRRTSSGLLPCTEFQYCDGAMIMLDMPMYLLSWSYAAVVPARQCGVSVAVFYLQGGNQLIEFVACHRDTEK